MRRHFSPVKLLACDDILFTRETVNVLLAELESNQLEEIIFPDGFFWKVDVDTHHIVPVIASGNWCYQGHCLDFLDIQLWRISHIKRTSAMIHPEWTHNSRLMNQNFIQKYGQIIGSWLFQNWICRIVTIFLESLLTVLLRGSGNSSGIFGCWNVKLATVFNFFLHRFTMINFVL